MKKKNPTITHNEWVRSLFPTYKERPPNSFTIADAIKVTGDNERTIRSRLKIMVDKKKLKLQKGREDGRIINYYIPIENATKKKST